MYALHCHSFEQTVKNYSRMVLKEITLDSLLLLHRNTNKIEIPRKLKNTLKLNFHIKLTTYKQKKHNLWGKWYEYLIRCPLVFQNWVGIRKFTVFKFIGSPWFKEVSTLKDGIKISRYSYIFQNLKKPITIKYAKICGKGNWGDWNVI